MTAKDARRRKLLRTIGLHFSGMDMLKALGMYLMSVMGCLLLRSFDMHNDTSYVAMIFLLDVFLTAFWTDGYLLGIIAAVVGVFSVDYIFTYPFWHISFTLTGFPLTFLVMMTISILTATVTSRAKQMEQIRRDAEREKMYADLLRAVLEGFGPEILEEHPVEYRCYCSRERVVRALVSMGREELTSMIEEQGEAQLTCQFCDKVYRFTKEELEGILASL